MFRVAEKKGGKRDKDIQQAEALLNVLAGKRSQHFDQFNQRLSLARVDIDN
ncbi:MAG TPA: hypothetical protein VGR76_20455 [Candidatus Angelobacter sp.]|nr:hypothetical protein [Candidatus Angelobacter sp.]